ncbi:MAG: hypothetical protein KCHDKBKB_00372 [Elusimicrobia bacterium]|nr:hypothetical protein [Elusimicrobiota bacterium]
MRVKEGEERLAQAKKAVLSLLKNENNLHPFQFSDQLWPVEKDDIENLTPTGKISDLAQALYNSFREVKYKGALLFSDGRHVGKDDPVTMAATLGAPLFLVGVGNPTLFKDVSIKSVQNPPFVFKNVPASLSVTLGVVGYPGMELSVQLREGERVLAVQKVQVQEARSETTVTFGWIPSSVGTKTLVVDVGQYKGEVSTLNNRREIVLDVGRDKFRVLYICGEPGPEYGFLRHQFKSDPAVELVTFVILRNAGNSVSIPDAELSLIPFPTQDVLINQMATFDLVVFEEFSYQLYGLSPSLIYAIRQKVQEGGSFLLMGGPLTFGAGSPYGLPGIREMIPVEFNTADVKVINTPVTFQVKAPDHPILRLDANSDRNKEIWKNLPELEGVTQLPMAKAGATVLGVARIQNQETPVLTVWKYGKGRVGALTARTTWRWSMLNSNPMVPADVYQRFWKNMVLWLTHSDEFKAVRLGLGKKVAHPHEKSVLRVWVFDDYFKPVSDVDVQIQLTAPDGEKLDLKPISETSGVFVTEFKPEVLGIHRAQVWVKRAGKRFGGDSLNVRVIENLQEEDDLSSHFDLMRDMARVTGGKFVTLDEFTPELFTEFNQQSSLSQGRKILLWNSPWFLAILLGWLILEWMIRKKQGLP